jgi:hypothetical protein
MSVVYSGYFSPKWHLLFSFLCVNVAESCFLFKLAMMPLRLDGLLTGETVAFFRKRAARHRYEENFSSLALGQAYSKLFEDVVKR